MKRLRPFFSYFGSKWRLAPKYSAPLYDHIIEPFAGSAQYATLYYDRKITLVDKNEKVCGVWDYLIRSSPSEIMALPSEVYHIDDWPNLCQEAKWLIGFWLQSAGANPHKKVSTWAISGAARNSYWGIEVKSRIAPQVVCIKHWQILHACYCDLANPLATWFIDPPYNNRAGSKYPHKIADYRQLANWCLARAGQTIVCENEGATWLPFRELAVTQSANLQIGASYSYEAVYEKIQTPQPVHAH